MGIFRLFFLMIFASHCFATSSVKENPTKSVWEEQKIFFQENGYLWIKNFYSREQVALLQLWADEVHAASQNLLSLSNNNSALLQSFFKNIPGTLIVVPEARNPLQVCRAEDMLTCYPDFYHFISGTLTNYLCHLLDEPYVLFKDKINFKWPGGGAFLPHQDFPAYELFGPRAHVTAMICVDRATLENGCLQVATNWRETFSGDSALDTAALESGTAVLPYVVGGSGHGSIQPEYSKKITWLPIEASPGDVVLITSYLPHYSEPNKSNSARRAMFLTHNKLKEGDHRKAYYHAKRHDPDNPVFHFATPTKARSK